MNRATIPTMKKVCLFCVLALALSGCEGMQLGSMKFPTLGQTDGNTGGSRGQQQQRQPQQRQVGNQNFPSGLPADFQAFKARYQSVGTSPEGAVRMYFDALYSYIDPARKAEGAKMLRYSMHEGKNWEKSPFLATFVSRLKDSSYHYIFRSFAEGAYPENSYEMNPDDYQIMIVNVRQETDYVSISIRSNGADSPRLLQAQQFEDGLWYLTNNHGTYSEVRKPDNQVQRGGHDADLD